MLRGGDQNFVFVVTIVDQQTRELYLNCFLSQLWVFVPHLKNVEFYTCFVFGTWYLVPCSVRGPWSFVLGTWNLVLGSVPAVIGAWSLVLGTQFCLLYFVLDSLVIVSLFIYASR